MLPGKMMTRYREKTLANGLHLVFHDESNRYFGDYHRVCIVVSLSFAIADLPASAPADAELRDRALRQFGETFAMTRRLERMAVPTAKVEEVRSTLVDDFMKHSAAYFARPATLQSLVTKELSKHRSSRSYD